MQLNRLPLWALAFVAAVSMSALAARACADAMDLSTMDRPDNQLQVRQLHVTNPTQVLPEGNVGQSLTCWQVLHGSWNGQNLDGLSIVLVKQLTETNGNTSVDRFVYVSDSATAAQRVALVAAVAASNPTWFPDIKSIRIEPASIQIEQTDGTTVVLHLGRIS